MTSQWSAIETRDHKQDGQFVYGVKTTGIFCRPSCPSRLPSPSNVSYFTAPEEAEAAGFRACKRCRPADPLHPKTNLIEAACRFIDANAEAFQLAALAKHMGYSPFHLQRTFKAATGITPRAYAESQRRAALKQILKAPGTVTDSLYQAGFSSSSAVYGTADSYLGMTPATYRKGGEGAHITYAVAPSRLGLLLLAQTERGVCSLAFGESEGDLEEALRKEFPKAVIARAESPHLHFVLSHLEGSDRSLHLPLDIQATAFQRRVWEILQRIPYGNTRSYGAIARELGNPKASRAVARACATNPVALAIPCHRVVREGGALSGYRWGLNKKQALLDRERA